MAPTALRAYYESRAAAGGPDRFLLETVAATLARADRLKPRHLDTWARFLRLLDDHKADPRAVRSCAVTANLVAIVAFGDAEDFATLASLVEQLGRKRMARLQHRCSKALETDPSLPWTTTAARRMVGDRLHERLVESPATVELADSISAACSRAARDLLFEGIQLEWTAPMVDSVEEFVAMTDTSSIIEWRHQLAMVAASPWSPYSHRLQELAEQADRPHAAAALADLIEACRELYKEREREFVAQEIKRLVAMSGVTQRDFAAWIGTSASRLSTYITGAVTPSAAMLLRITRAAATLQERAKGERPAGAGLAPDATVEPWNHVRS